MDNRFPSIDNHYKDLDVFLGKMVFAVEKLDGSNFSVVVRPNQPLVFRSKNQVLKEDRKGFFGDAITIAERIEEEMRSVAEFLKSDTYIFFFEVFGRGVQSRINYGDKISDQRLPSESKENGRTLALIDAAVINKDESLRWLPQPIISVLCSLLKVYRPAQTLYTKFSLEHMEKIEAQEGTEGYVIKVHGFDEQNNVIRPTDWKGNPVQVKLKTNWFASYEKNGKTKKAKPKTPTPPAIIEMLNSSLNFGRLHSVYSHGNEELSYEMSDMRVLPSLVVKDLETEFPEVFANHEEKVIKKATSKMLPGLLKDWLVERQK